MTTPSLEINGDWNTAGNWAPTAIPVDNDNALVPGRLAANVTDSGDQGAVDLDLLDIHKDFAHLFGTAATPIHIGADELRFQGSIGAHFNLDDDGAVATQVERAWIEMRNPGTPVNLGKHATAHADSDYLDIYLQRGALTLLSSISYAAASVVHVGHVQDQRGDATLVIDASGPTVPELQMNGGRCRCNSVLTLARIGAGSLLIQDTAAVTTAYIDKGGSLRIDHGGDGVTVATKVHVKAGGVLDLLGTSAEKTITTVIAEKNAIILRDPTIHIFSTFHDRRGPV